MKIKTKIAKESVKIFFSNKKINEFERFCTVLQNDQYILFES